MPKISAYRVEIFTSRNTALLPVPLAESATLGRARMLAARVAERSRSGKFVLRTAGYSAPFECWERNDIGASPRWERTEWSDTGDMHALEFAAR